MSKDAKGRDHTKPCGDESCGITDIMQWRSQAQRELELANSVRDKMTDAEKAKLASYWQKYQLSTKTDTIPTSITSVVYEWANLAADAERLRLDVEARGDDPPAGDDDDKPDDDKPSGDDGDVNIDPDLDLDISPDVKLDALRGANFGGLMPVLAVVGLGAVMVYLGPTRARKGKRK